MRAGITNDDIQDEIFIDICEPSSGDAARNDG
jgi:hypothetical protein